MKHKPKSKTLIFENLSTFEVQYSKIYFASLKKLETNRKNTTKWNTIHD